MVEGGVSSITLHGEGHHWFIGTEASQIYRLDSNFIPELMATSHNSAVWDVAFPV